MSAASSDEMHTSVSRPHRPDPTVLLDLHEDVEEGDLQAWVGPRLRGELDGGGLSLTPILGPQCVDVPADREDGRGPSGVVQALFIDDSLFERPRDDDSGQAGEEDDLDLNEQLGFFENILTERLHGRKVLRKVAEDALEKKVTKLRRALFDCAFRATRLYAGTWVGALSPVTDWILHHVSLSEIALGDLEESIQAAVRVIDTLPPKETGLDGRLYLLGANSLRLRLINLRNLICDSECLRGSTVEWFTDIFWHTMIFDSPCYPKVDEFALQVSLVATSRDRPFWKMEPAATERHKITELSHAVAKGVARGFHLPSPEADSDGFHRGLADVLHAQYATWEQQVRLERRPSPFPLAISTTFDLELERALATVDAGHSRAAFHVAFPVVHSTDDRRRGQLRWLVGTFPVIGKNSIELADADKLHERLRTPEDNTWYWLEKLAPEFQVPTLQGPLVLKVNGSPLHVLDPDVARNKHLVERAGPDDGGGSKDSFRSSRRPTESESAESVWHAPVLWEFDVLQIMHIDEWAYGARRGDRKNNSKSENQGLPIAITDQLDDPRRFWLIAGQRLTDWSARMQLFLHVSRAVVRNTSAPHALAVSREPDRDRARLLAGLGIKRAVGEFEWLTSSLHEVAGIARRREARR